MRVIVCGGRLYTDAEVIREELEALRLTASIVHDGDYGSGVTVVHGGARGADSFAARIAAELDYEAEEFPADWSTGRGAGPQRNQRMVDAGADLVIAFPGGRGTADCVRRARAAGIPVRCIT